MCGTRTSLRVVLRGLSAPSNFQQDPSPIAVVDCNVVKSKGSLGRWRTIGATRSLSE
jgi:hypothetical protein